jgi:hypothetical protein
VSWKAVFAFSILAVATVTVPRPICDCVVFPSTEAERLAKTRRDLQAADAVFVGTMGDLVDSGNSLGRRVEVNQVWKGAPGKDVVLAMVLRNTGSFCWYMPESGQHLIFASRDSSGWWIAQSCASTGPISERAEASRFLKQLCQDSELCSQKRPQAHHLPSRVAALFTPLVTPPSVQPEARVGPGRCMRWNRPRS